MPFLGLVLLLVSTVVFLLAEATIDLTTVYNFTLSFAATGKTLARKAALEKARAAFCMQKQRCLFADSDDDSDDDTEVDPIVLEKPGYSFKNRGVWKNLQTGKFSDLVAFTSSRMPNLF